MDACDRTPCRNPKTLENKCFLCAAEDLPLPPGAYGVGLSATSHRAHLHDRKPYSACTHRHRFASQHTRLRELCAAYSSACVAHARSTGVFFDTRFTMSRRMRPAFELDGRAEATRLACRSVRSDTTRRASSSLVTAGSLRGRRCTGGRKRPGRDCGRLLAIATTRCSRPLRGPAPCRFSDPECASPATASAARPLRTKFGALDGPRTGGLPTLATSCAAQRKTAGARTPAVFVRSDDARAVSGRRPREARRTRRDRAAR